MTAYTDGQVTRRSNRTKVGYHEAADMAGYQGVEPGDFVVHGLDILRGSVGVSDSRGAMSSVCTVCQPSGDIDARYTAYAIRLHAQSGYTRALARGVREGGADFRRWDTLADLPVPVPPAAEQGRIADFLDDQVARIENIIAARSAQSAAFVTMFERELEWRWEVLAKEHGVARTAYLLSGMEQGWSPEAEARQAGEEEWAVMRAGCVNGGRFDATDHKALPASLEPRRQYEIRSGDLLMSRASGSQDLIGSVGVVESGTRSRLLLPDKIYRLFPDRTKASAPYLAMMLRSQFARRKILAGISGAEGMASNLPAPVIKSVPIPAVPRESQKAIVDQYELVRERTARQVARLGRSNDLLTELKRSLITAAVTGEFDVSSADGSQVPVP